jgi:DNA-binding beta-propeller fold protein YncE
MIPASGWIIGKFIESVDWRDILRRGGWIVALVAPIGLAAAVQTFSPWLTDAGRPKPFAGYDVGQLNTTLQFLSALFVLSISLAAVYWVGQRIGVTGLLQVLTALALGALAVLTVRTAWALAYLNYDDASEFLVYAHGSPEVRVVMEQIEEISLRTSGEHSLEIGYTADGSYPIMWYLRNYHNAIRLPNPPSRADLGKPVILAGDKEWGGIEPYLGDNYMCNHYDFMWWPMQDYAGLNWERIRYALVDPEMRGAVWDVIFRRDYRKYEQATGKTVRLSEWPLREGFRFCLRRDLISQVWSELAGGGEFAAEPDEVGTLASSYATVERPAVAELEIRSLGAFGSLNSPHGMACDTGGFMYVADTDNHRIVKLSPEGEVVDTWDSTWWRGLESWKPNGCLDAANQPLALGDGEFCEPWGVAVGPDSRVYVADTWNHRVQVFASDGRFVAKVGSFGQSGSDVLAAPAQFYGPRDVAVDQDGRVYVSDTGNKRIQVFDAELNFLRAFGGPGILEGRLDEPVGLAIGPDRLLYVADTWNRRVQVFTLEGDLVRAWPVAGWESQSVFNKPYVATDAAGHIYVSDPEAQRVIAFDSKETPLAALDLGGAGGNAPPMPAGVCLVTRDQLWVSDAANHRLLRFPPMILAEPSERGDNQP